MEFIYTLFDAVHKNPRKKILPNLLQQSTDSISVDFRYTLFDTAQ